MICFRIGIQIFSQLCNLSNVSCTLWSSEDILDQFTCCLPATHQTDHLIFSQKPLNSLPQNRLYINEAAKYNSADLK